MHETPTCSFSNCCATGNQQSQPEMDPESDRQMEEASSSAEARQEPPPADESPWGNLPGYMFSLIYDRLFPCDRIRFAGVCSTWRHFCASRPAPSFPLLMPPLQQTSNCLLRSPFHDHIYRRYHLPEARCMPCRGSIGGWLLYGALSVGERPFFFDPTGNNARVFLPRWRWPQWKPRWDAIISSAPTNLAGCTVVFLADKMILHCKARDEMWSACEADANLDNCHGVFCKGTLHVISENGRLGVVNFANIQNAVTWLVMDVGPLHQQQPQVLPYGRQFLLESAKTLLLVFFNWMGSWSVFKADLRAMAWRPVEELGDRSLFLAPGGSVSAVAAEAGVEANRLYLAHGVTQPNMPGDSWMSVATHARDNCWSEISVFRYTDQTAASLRTSRWVFQRVVARDRSRVGRRRSWASWFAFCSSETA